MTEITRTSALREHRQALGWSQEALAKHLGVHQISVSQWERGVAWPSLDKLPALARAYQMDMGALVELLIAAKGGGRHGAA